MFGQQLLEDKTTMASDRKYSLQKAREEFLQKPETDTRNSSQLQFDQKMSRIRHLSVGEPEIESDKGEFRKRSNSYGQAVSPKLGRIKEFFVAKSKPSSSSESLSKSPPGRSFLKPWRTPPVIKRPSSSADGSLKSSPALPAKSTRPTHSRQNSQNEPAQLPGIHDDEYNMNHKYRGKAVIFNHIKFQDEDLPEREGAEKDVERLKKTLLKLGFLKSEIEVLTDSPLNDITKKLDNLGQENHTDNDLLMIFVLTHGEKDDRIHAYDIEYQVSRLWKPFTAEKCKSLAGKPKIFFIVACRGDSADSGTHILVQPNRRKQSLNTETDAVLMGPAVSYTIPVWADFLTVYSTFQGFFSFRDADEGTWYIKALCEEINKIDKKPIHFMDMLTRVNRKVAISYETFHENPLASRKKQCPFISSTLTRVIYIDDKK